MWKIKLGSEKEIIKCFLWSVAHCMESKFGHIEKNKNVESKLLICGYEEGWRV